MQSYGSFLPVEVVAVEGRWGLLRRLEPDRVVAVAGTLEVVHNHSLRALLRRRRWPNGQP
jgi:hypothetical protein